MNYSIHFLAVVALDTLADQAEPAEDDTLNPLDMAMTDYGMTFCFVYIFHRFNMFCYLLIF